MKKVDYYGAAYRRMRRMLRTHPIRLIADNVAEPLDANFVFLTMNSGPEKKTVIEALSATQAPFIDTGIGVSNDPNGITGQIRVTTSTAGRSDYIARDGLICFQAGDDGSYDTNLQVAELDAKAAVLAVMRFKKSLDFYADAEDERHCVYATDTNEIHNRYGETDPTRVALVEGAADSAAEVVDPAEDAA